MFVSEEEARESICPLMMRCDNREDVHTRGEPAILVHDTCKGSDCKMGWRWARTIIGTQHKKLGYCGYANVPEDR